MSYIVPGFAGFSFRYSDDWRGFITREFKLLMSRFNQKMRQTMEKPSSNGDSL